MPVKLTLLSTEDIDMLSSGFTRREVREKRIIRLFKEGYEQGGVLSNNDIALLLNISPSTVSKQVREYMERTKEVVPTRGTVHDLGRAIEAVQQLSKPHKNCLCPYKKRFFLYPAL